MKLSFKNIIIIFLVALLGSGLGTFGVMSYYNNKIDNTLGKTDVVVNEVEYTSIQKSDYTKAIEKAINTVVEVSCEVQTTDQGYFFFNGGTSKASSAGSGVIFTSDGYIVTNEHVINGLVDESTLKVKIYTGETYNAKVVGYDSRTDLAVLKIDANDLPYASFVDSSKLMIGQDVIAIGNPLGLGISCSNGIISALEKEIYVNRVYMTVMQTNAAVNNGNSGGGLFDINGDLVGIVNAKKISTSSNVEGMNYAIPANIVVRIINELIENGYVKDRAALGVKIYTPSAYLTTNGALISEVIEGSSAEKAGLMANDLIIDVDGTEIKSYADLSKVLDTKAVGDTVVITAIREDKEMKFNVTLQSSTK